MPRKTRRFLFTMCWPLVLAASASLHARPGRAAENPEAYVDASSYVQGEAQIEAWTTMVGKLRRDFDQICGDTFCEGEFSNIASLRFRCSVHRTSGQIGTCVWLFAASNEEIDPASGAIAVQPKYWSCRVVLGPGTTVAELLSAVAGESPLHAPLPRSGRSIYDGLVDCL